ncbi:MAG: hypothetical protein QXT19_01525 [Candidatus Woesearchaeota archaeon]
MEEKTTAITVLAIVAVIAVCGCVLLYKSLTTLAVYEQPANNKPPFLLTSSYMKDFDLCRQFLCGYYTPGYYGESEPATVVGYEVITNNLVCRCPDGRTFQVRPDRIEVETY